MVAQLFIQHLEAKPGRSLSPRTAWSTDGVSGQPGLYSLSCLIKTKTKNKQTKKEKKRN
jgi:hypothetical protein